MAHRVLLLNKAFGLSEEEAKAIANHLTQSFSIGDIADIRSERYKGHIFVVTMALEPYKQHTESVRKLRIEAYAFRAGWRAAKSKRLSAQEGE